MAKTLIVSDFRPDHSDLPSVQPVPYDCSRQNISTNKEETYVKKFGINVHTAELHFCEKFRWCFVMAIVHAVCTRQIFSVESIQGVHETLKRCSDKAEIM